jgi:hypothetical protein
MQPRNLFFAVLASALALFPADPLRELAGKDVSEVLSHDTIRPLPLSIKVMVLKQLFPDFAALPAGQKAQWLEAQRTQLEGKGLPSFRRALVWAPQTPYSDSIVKNGTRLYVIQDGARTIMLAPMLMEGFLTIALAVANGEAASSRMEVDPETFEALALVPKYKWLPRVAPSKVASKARHGVGWKSFLYAFATANPQKKVVVNDNGSFDGRINEDGQVKNFSGTYSGSRVISVPDREQEERNRQELQRMREDADKRESQVFQSALRRNTVMPGENAVGLSFFANEKKSQGLLFVIPLGDTVYEFPVPAP